SLHSSEYMASSTWLGGAPCLAQISAYSAAVSPSACASASVGGSTSTSARPRAPTVPEPRCSDSPALRTAACSDTHALLHGGAHRLEDAQAVGRATKLVDGVLGVGHQPEDVAG